MSSNVHYKTANNFDNGVEDDQVKPRGLSGLQNLGNTCFMNAALQALSNCPQLTKYMLQQNPLRHKGNLARSYIVLIREMWGARKRAFVVPSGVLQVIKTVSPFFRGYRQQEDAQEFLRCFLDQMHQELKETVLVEGKSDSEDDDDYETCDSGLSSEISAFGDENCKQRLKEECLFNDVKRVVKNDNCHIENGRDTNKQSTRFRSIISDLFDGKLLSSVQCRTCDYISTTLETFQDLSLPIPNKDHLHLLKMAASQSIKENPGRIQKSSCNEIESSKKMTRIVSILSFIGGVFGSLSSFYNLFWTWLHCFVNLTFCPSISLQDCLFAFFSADELKGDDMYHCDKCKILRNGVKFSQVLCLPEILCIHLKRFRHERTYQSKIYSHVTFPLKGLDMSPFMASNCSYESSNNRTLFDLIAVICHNGSPNSGHYTTYALNWCNHCWYEFDDLTVTSVDAQTVASCEAYVLVYRKL